MVNQILERDIQILEKEIERLNRHIRWDSKYSEYYKDQLDELYKNIAILKSRRKFYPSVLSVKTFEKYTGAKFSWLDSLRYYSSLLLKWVLK